LFLINNQNKKSYRATFACRQPQLKPQTIKNINSVLYAVLAFFYVVASSQIFPQS
jgi:hypothetical protein